MAPVKRELRYFENEIQRNTAAAELLFSSADKALQESRPFLFVLSGGNTPLKFYQLLAARFCKDKICRDNIHFFFSDERMVPPAHYQSNYYNADELLFKNLEMNQKCIHRIKGELSTAESASEDYEKHLKKFFNLTEEGFPVFDLILLGLGKDGHTASLFPGDQGVCENRRWVIPIEHPAAEPFIPRVSLTLPVLNSARNILFLVNKDNKEEMLDRILNQKPGEPETEYPASRINPQGRLYWYIRR